MKLIDYRKCFDLNYGQFITQNSISSNHIHKNARYEKIEDVNRVDLPDNQFFFFKDEKLKMIYISNYLLTQKIWSEFNEITNTKTPEKSVRSRAGKTSNQLVFAEQGISASITNEDIDFIEIYPPSSLQDYLKNVYQEPNAFIR